MNESHRVGSGPCGTGLPDPTALALQSRGSISRPGCLPPPRSSGGRRAPPRFPRSRPVLPGAAYKAPRGPASGSRSVSGCERGGGGYPPRDRRRGPSKWKLGSRVACRPAFQVTPSHAGRACLPALDSSVLGLARMLERPVWRLWFSSQHAGCGGRARHSPEEWRAGVLPGPGLWHLDGSRDSGAFSRLVLGAEGRHSEGRRLAGPRPRPGRLR